jgi:hypothetical protein
MLNVLTQSLLQPRSDTRTKSIDLLASKSCDGRAKFLLSLHLSISLALVSTLLSLTIVAAQFCLPVSTTAYPSLSVYPISHYSSSCFLGFWMPIATLHVMIILAMILGACVFIWFVWPHSQPHTNGCWCSVCNLYVKQHQQSRVSKLSADKQLTGALFNYSRNHRFHWSQVKLCIQILCLVPQPITSAAGGNMGHNAD